MFNMQNVVDLICIKRLNTIFM